MNNNAIINSTFKDLLEIIDARAAVNIFVENKETGKQELIKDARVYEILSDNDFLNKYKKYDVAALCCGLVTNILIKEA